MAKLLNQTFTICGSMDISLAWVISLRIEFCVVLEFSVPGDELSAVVGGTGTAVGRSNVD
jgi:hypothetical protein